MNANHPPASAEQIIAMVSQAFGVTRSDLLGRSRLGHICLARHAAFWLLRERGHPRTWCRRSYQEIGRIMGGRDHTTARHCCTAAAEFARSNPDYAQTLASLAAADRFFEPELV